MILYVAVGLAVLWALYNSSGRSRHGVSPLFFVGVPSAQLTLLLPEA